MGVLVQVIATIFLCVSCINLGMNVAWPSSTVLLFKSENTTLERPMDDMEIALCGSLPSLGTLAVLPFLVGSVLDLLGRKWTTLLTSLLFVISWSMIAVTDKVVVVLIARVISGCAHTIFLEVLIYISEIVQVSIRGILTSGPILFMYLGILISYFLGGILEYHMMVYTNLLFSVVGVFMIAVLKESPVCLMSKGNEKEAAKSLAFYLRLSSTSKTLVAELNNIRRTLKSNDEDGQSLMLEEQRELTILKPKPVSCWQFFRTTPSIRRQFCLALVLNTAWVGQGLPVVQLYAEPFFAAALGNSISPNVCSMILGSVVLVAGSIAAVLCERIGRRPLLIHSSIVSGICCVLIGTQIAMEWLPMWMLPLVMCVFAASHTFGPGTMGFVISAEIYLPEVKSVLMMMAEEWSLACQFCCYFLFNILVPLIGLPSIFYFFSVVCFACSIFFFHFLPETKGLTVYEIQGLFKKKTDKKTSQ